MNILRSEKSDAILRMAGARDAAEIPIGSAAGGAGLFEKFVLRAMPEDT